MQPIPAKIEWVQSDINAHGDLSAVEEHMAGELESVPHIRTAMVREEAVYRAYSNEIRF
jgi:hypothetical protein